LLSGVENNHHLPGTSSVGAGTGSAVGAGDASAFPRKYVWAKFGRNWTNLGKIWEKVIKIWANFD